MNKLGIKKKPRDVKLMSAATTYTLERRDTGECAFIVYVSPESVEWGAHRDVGTIAHEASHIARSYFESLGEASPSDELQAYTIGHIVSELCGAHFAWKRKKLRKAKA
ncbi:MAG: hypothetical protein RSD15_09805 [Gordonibacter sp.]